MNESQIVFASNAARDLTNLVCSFLKIWKELAQDEFGVRVPDGKFTVVFLPMTEPGKLPVRIVHTETKLWETPVYYDTSSDYFQEGYGGGYGSDRNVSHMKSHSKIVTKEKTISIPFHWLTVSEQDMRANVTAVKLAETEKRKKSRLAEEAKDLEERLAAIRAEQA